MAHSVCGLNLQGVQVKLRYPLTMRAISERLRDDSCGKGKVCHTPTGV